MTNKIKNVILVISIITTIISSTLFLFMRHSYNQEKSIWKHLSKNEQSFLLRKEDGIYNNVDSYALSLTDYSILYYLVINEGSDNTEVYTKTNGEKKTWYIIRSNIDNGREYITFDVSTFATKEVTEKEFVQSIKRTTGLIYSENRQKNTAIPLYVEKYVD